MYYSAVNVLGLLTDTTSGKEALGSGRECQRLCMQWYSVQWETAKISHETSGSYVTDKAKEGNGSCFSPVTERDDMDLQPLGTRCMCIERWHGRVTCGATRKKAFLPVSVAIMHA